MAFHGQSRTLGLNSTRLTATATASCVLQDLPETVSPGESPQNRLMMVEGSLVHSIPPGTQVTVTAVYTVMKVCLHLRAPLLCCKCWYSMCDDLVVPPKDHGKFRYCVAGHQLTCWALIDHLPSITLAFTSGVWDVLTSMAYYSDLLCIVLWLLGYWFTNCAHNQQILLYADQAWSV